MSKNEPAPDGTGIPDMVETPADKADAPAVNAATTAPQVKPLVTYDVASVQLHLVPGGRHILVSKKTLAVKLPRDPGLELDDPNVRLVLAMAAGPDFVAGVTDPDPQAAMERAYAKAVGFA